MTFCVVIQHFLFELCLFVCVAHTFICVVGFSICVVLFYLRCGFCICVVAFLFWLWFSCLRFRFFVCVVVVLDTRLCEKHKLIYYNI